MISTFFRLVYSKLTGKKMPLAVSWALTYRCGLKCAYCDYWNQKTNELSFSQILKIIDEIAKAKVKFISFTGGDPLLRKDIGKIINYTYSKGIFVSLSTNGLLVPEKIDELKNADRTQVSIDGPEKINDILRGNGSYKAALLATKTLIKAGKKVRIATVISKNNINQLDHVLSLSSRFKIPILFQPVTFNILGSSKLHHNIPAKKDYIKAIDFLISQKKRGALLVNSFTGLNFLKNYPEKITLNCRSGINCCDIEPDGTLLACDRFPLQQTKLNILEHGFSKGFDKLPTLSCGQCWCCASLVEFNYLASFNIEVMLNMFKLGLIKR